MKHILVATDFSERSDRALRRATLLAKRYGAAVTLLHIFDDSRSPASAADFAIASERLKSLVETLWEIDGIAGRSHIARGTPWEGIVGHSEEIAPDLIVMGAHRRQVVRDLFMASTGDYTIRASRLPVLLVNASPATPYVHVLVASDLSASSGEAVRAVANLGLDKQASVSVVHVYDTPGAGFLSRASSNTEKMGEYLSEELERASGELAAFLEKLDFEPVGRFLRPNSGSPATISYAVAQEIAADLLVVGIDARTDLAKLLVGSLAEEVLRISEQDVLAVPFRGDD